MVYNKYSRRDFIKTSLVAGSALQFGGLGKLDLFAHERKYQVCLFSKVLQFLTVEEMVSVVAELGFDGIDLPVRPWKNVHLRPERVEEDLPKIVEALHKVGIKTIMLTTQIVDANNVNTEKILKTANALGIKNYRMGYYFYPENKSVQSTLNDIKIKLKEFEDINRQYNINGSYQNHSIDKKLRFGSPVMDLWECIRDLDPNYVSCQFDIKHAMVEGSTAWKIYLKALSSHIRSFVVKDYEWTKLNNKWITKNTLAGNGAVDFEEFSKMIKEFKIPGPISLHTEYPLGGAESGKLNPSMPKKKIFEYLRKDLKFTRSLF